MMKNKLIRVSSFLLMLLLVLPTLLLFFAFSVGAESSGGIDGYYEDLAQTDVMEDLKKYGVNTSEYVIDKTVRPGSDQDYLTIVRLVEFGYDYKQELENYGLYVYIYNPTCVDLSASDWNKIQIGLKKSTGDQPTVQKKDLILIDHTDDHLFYKYQVKFVNTDMANLRTMAPARRIYKISGIEFEIPGLTDPHDYEIAGEYTFTGFLKGYGIREWDTETLYCSVEQFLTIKTELHMTNWRSDRSEKGEHYYKDVAGVYFSIPNWILNKYGDEENPLKGLYEVEGEYYEYKLNGLVTTNEDTYDYVSHYQCQSFADGISSHNVVLSFWTGHLSHQTPYIHYNLDRYYNIDTFNNSGSNRYYPGYRLNKLGLVFWDGMAESVDDVKMITTQQIFERIATLQSKGEDPYLSYVDSGHIKGYNTYKITAGQEETLTKVDTSSKEDDKFWSWFWSDSHYAQDVTIPALQLVDFGFLDWESWLLKKSVIADKYFLDEQYVGDFAEFVTEKSHITDLTGSSVFMMHYSTTDTYIAPAYIHRAYDRISTLDAPGDHYYFEQSVFQDFDILSITMKDEYGNTTKIPVVADPKDFVPDLLAPGELFRPGSSNADEAPKLDFSWWDNLNGLGKTLVIVAGLLVLALVIGLFGPIFKPIGALFGWIFSGIGAVFRGGTKLVGNLFTAREKSYDAKRKRIEDRQFDEDRVSRRAREDYSDRRKQVVDSQDDEDRARRHKREDLDMTEKRYDSKQKRIKDRQDIEDRARRHEREDFDYKRKKTEAFKSDYEFAKRHASKDQPYQGKFENMGKETDE